MDRIWVKGLFVEMGRNIANLCAGGYDKGKSNKIPFL